MLWQMRTLKDQTHSWESRQLHVRMGLGKYSGKLPKSPKLSVLADLYILCK